MAYGLKYTVTLAGKTLQISQKNYLGSSSTITPASPAVVHSWDKDEPTAPIKGSSVTAGVVGVPLLDFYANNDDEFKGELFNGSDLLFSGFLVQDDCTEGVDDLLHPVILSFTDNLGLLKDVDLGTALAAISSTGSKISLLEIIQACLTATGVVLPLEVFSALKEDNQDTASSFLDQTLIAKESFLKSEREYDNCYNALEQILTALQATLVQANGQWNIIRWHEHTPTSYQYDSSFALTGTGVYNNFKVFGRNQSIYPEYPYSKRILRPYNVVKETFDYKFLFNVLKNADLKDLGAQLAQYTVNEEDYKPNEDVDSTNDYTVTYKEYAAPSWTPNNIGTPNDVYIRVIEDDLHYELERYLVVEKNSTSSSDKAAVFAVPIELSKDDIVEFSFSFRTTVNNSQPSPDIDFNMYLTQGAYTTPSSNSLDFSTGNYYRLKYTTDWFDVDDSLSDTYGGKNNDTTNKFVGVDVSEWQTVSIRSKRAPADGMLYIFLSDLAGSTFLGSGTETHYRDFSFKILYAINDSTKITGQTHTDTQDINIKNKDESDINIDDSPRGSIAGTLFLPDIGPSGQLLRTRSWSLPSLVSVQSCKLFHFQVFGPSDPYTITGQYCDGSPINISGMGSGGNPAPICGRPGTIVTTGCEIVQQDEDCGTYTPDVIPRRLGEIVTHEVKQWRSMSRTITEGTLHGDILVSPMTTFTNPAFPNLKFVPGNMEIDYANQTCRGTLHELYATDEAIVTSDYDFEYIYDTK